MKQKKKPGPCANRYCPRAANLYCHGMMICAFCGGDHSWFYCRTKPEGWKPPKKSTAAPVSEPRKDQPTPRKGASRTVPQASHADTRVEGASGGSDPSRATGGSHQQPALRTEVALGAVDLPRIEGAKFVADLPPGTQLMAYGNRILAAGPGLAPSIVTSAGLVPLSVPLVDLKRGGRPKTVEDRKEYKRLKEQKRRDAAKASKETK